MSFRHSFLDLCWFIPLVFIFIIVNGRADDTTSFATARTLRTASGGILGYVDSGSGKVAVRNKSRKTIGYVDSNGTYNANRKKVAGSRLPGYLFCK